MEENQQEKKKRTSHLPSVTAPFLLKLMITNPYSRLVPYLTPERVKAYRLLDIDSKPITTVKKIVVATLTGKGILAEDMENEGTYILHTPALTAKEHQVWVNAEKQQQEVRRKKRKGFGQLVQSFFRLFTGGR